MTSLTVCGGVGCRARPQEKVLSALVFTGRECQALGNPAFRLAHDPVNDQLLEVGKVVASVELARVKRI